jgi:crotonobetainyl-CoA:carnitine CoA-transferase CaiB-like acyl-CoA transferase
VTPEHPLAGITVISLAGQYPGPFATMLLADLGADVTMVERPTGDPTRRHRVLFRALNRNKRSVALDLKTASGLAALRSKAFGRASCTGSVSPRSSSGRTSRI